MESLKKVHSLSVQLWRFIPAILSSIISLIEEELNADHEKVRLLATATIGQILGSEESLSIKTKVNFFVVHKRVWNNWLKRTTDVSPIVRSQWVQSLPEIVSKNPFLTSEINQMLSTCLHKCLIDSNEKVRESACLSASEIPYQQFMDKLATPDILQTLFELVREKNDTIRETSITVLNSIYSKFVLNDTDDQTELTKLISSIPNQILSLMYIDRPSITALVDLSFFEVLLSSFEPDNGKRVEKMLYLFDSLNDKGVSAFVAINKRQQQISKALLTFIETTETFHSLNNVEDKENNVNNQDQKETVLKLDKITDWLSALFPDSVTAKSCFERFYQLNRARFFHLVKNCINSDSDIPTIKNSMKELLGKLSDPKNIKLENERSKITTKEMVDNFKLLLLRASPIVYNSSNIEELIKYSKNSSHKYYSAANLILEQASSIQPGAFKSHVRELSTLIIGQEINKSNSLKAIYHLTKKYPDMFPQEISFLDSLKSLAVNGTPEEAKYSIKLIGLSDKKEISCTSIIDSIYPLDIDNDNFATHISSIAQIFLVDRFALADKENDITRLLIKDVLLSNRETDTPDETLLVNNLKSLLNENMTNDAKEEAEKKASSVFKLLMLLIGNNGELVNKADKSIPTPDPFKSRLRLAAGLSMLKLAKKPFYSELMTPARIRRLTFLMNDENTHVRSKFIESLSKALSSGLISERFIPILFFGALEQNSELKLTIEQWITRSFKDMLAKKNIKFEKALVRLIHILAHHEQFLELTKEGDDEAKLSGYKYASKILSYYVELIANGDNISLLYYLASRVKQQRDVTISASDYEEDTLSEQVLNLYRIAELAQIIIKNYADTKKWSVETWPVDFKLATDMYCPMATSKEAQSIVSQIFIPEVLQLELLKIINKRSRTVGVGIKKANDSTTGPKQGVKRSRAISKKTKTKKPKVVVEPTRRSSRATKDVNYANQLESESGSEFESDDE
ncbi:PDS5 Sister chromatid cohesion protein PDS5 [Candida maltosa Xu316]